MADTYTDNFGFTKPELDASNDTWDEKLNANFDSIDTELNRATSWTHKTAAYTAVARDRVLADTSGGAWTLTLPSAPETGDTIEVQDATGSWLAENLTVDGNGNDIDGSAAFTGDVDGDRFTLTYNGTEWARRGSAVVRLPLEFVESMTIDTAVAAVDIELPSDSGHVLILAHGVKHNIAGAVGMEARTSTDGVTFDSGASDYRRVGAAGDDSSLRLGTLDQARATNFETHLLGANHADAYTSVYTLNTSYSESVYGGYRKTAEVNTHIRLFVTGGNITAGTFLVYKYADLG